MIITRTPFRISFFGGGTDYPAWYRENGGAVLATTINKYCYISCRHLPPFFEHKHRIVYSKIENVTDYREIKHPAVRAVFGWAGCEKERDAVQHQAAVGHGHETQQARPDIRVATAKTRFELVGIRSSGLVRRDLCTSRARRAQAGTNLVSFGGFGGLP